MPKIETKDIIHIDDKVAGILSNPVIAVPTLIDWLKCSCGHKIEWKFDDDGGGYDGYCVENCGYYKIYPRIRKYTHGDFFTVWEVFYVVDED